MGFIADKHFMILNVIICFDTCLCKYKASDGIQCSNGSTHFKTESIFLDLGPEKTVSCPLKLDLFL